jgi:hypothetical protein
MPASLVWLGHTDRFRWTVRAMAAGPGGDPGELSSRLVTALAPLAPLTGRELGEPDWRRLLDALLLVTGYPAEPA